VNEDHVNAFLTFLLKSAFRWDKYFLPYDNE